MFYSMRVYALYRALSVLYKILISSREKLCFHQKISDFLVEKKLRENGKENSLFC